MRLIAIAILFVSTILHAEHHEKNNITSEPAPVFYNGLEAFTGGQEYRITLKSESGRIKHAKINQKNKENLSHGPHGWIRSKPKHEWNGVYYKIANLLPAGTVFKLSSAGDFPNGDLHIEIISKELLDIDKVRRLDDVIKIEEHYDIRAPVGESIPLDETPKQLPDGWDKEKGYGEILSQFEQGELLVDLYVVFANPDNQPTTIGKPISTIIGSLADGYGVPIEYGHDKKGKAWWRCEIILEFAHKLYENEQVINLIPHSN